MAYFQFRTGPATVGCIVAQGHSESTGCRFAVRAVRASSFYPMQAT